MLDRVLHIGHLTGPERPVLRAPAIGDELDGHRVVVQRACATLLERDDQATCLQQSQVMHDGHAPHLEGRRYLAHGEPWLSPQQVEDPPPRRMPQGIEHLGHVVEDGREAGRRVRHMLKNIYILACAASPSA